MTFTIGDPVIVPLAREAVNTGTVEGPCDAAWCTDKTCLRIRLDAPLEHRTVNAPASKLVARTS